MNRKLLLPLMVFSSYLIAACSGLSSEQNTAAADAIKALRKVEAATQVGVNYQVYGQMVIEAKAQVNEAAAKLPDGELKSELISSIDAYAEAGEAWGATISDDLYPDSRLANDLRAHYDLKIEPAYDEFGRKQQRSAILNAIWEAARKRLNRASSLLEK
jgi:hypothetical protein